MDQPMIRRDRWRAGFASTLAAFGGVFAFSAFRRQVRVEDLSHHMLRDIGFCDGRATEAAMRRAAGCPDTPDQF